MMVNNHSGSDWSVLSILTAFVRNLAMWLTLIVILGYGRKFLNFKHKWLPYLNEAAFPIYILHQTVLVIIGFYVIKLPLGLYTKFILIAAGTLIVCLVLYEFLVKRFALTRWLMGVKLNHWSTGPH